MTEEEFMERLEFYPVAQERSTANIMIDVYEATIQGLVITVRPGDWGWKASCENNFHETCYLGNAAKTLILNLINKGVMKADSTLLTTLDLFNY